MTVEEFKRIVETAYNLGYDTGRSLKIIRSHQEYCNIRNMQLLKYLIERRINKVDGDTDKS